MRGDREPRPESPIRWLAGEPEVCAALGRAWEDAEAAGAERTELRDRPERRRLLRFRWPDGRDLFVKQFYMGGRRHRARKRFVRLLRVEAARREWRAFSRLARAGIPAPTPRALGILPGGDRILAVDFLAGHTLEAELRSGSPNRARLARELGQLVAALHAQGIVHRDLHHGNVFMGEAGPLLLDLQLARPGRSRKGRLRDVGDLEASLESGFSLAQRVRFRSAALALSRPYDETSRQALREAGAASLERSRAHATSRCRRALRPGRRFARTEYAGARGLRNRELEPAVLDQLLSAHQNGLGEILQRDARSCLTAVAADGLRVVVKEFPPVGLLGSLTDLFRGSPARRGWLAGFGLEAHGIGAATPLAFLERRRLGLPSGSWLVMADLRPAQPASVLAATRAGEVVDALTRLVQRLHARGILHGELTADRVWLAPDGDALAPRLAGLENVRFRARLSEAERRRGLALLNATLPDAVGAAARRRAFARYALLLPFSSGSQAALGDVVAASLAIGGRWSGTDCARTAGITPGPRP